MCIYIFMTCVHTYSMKIFRPQNFFLLPDQFQKLLAFLIPSGTNFWTNVDGSWRVTSTCMYVHTFYCTRTHERKLRDSTLIQVARSCSKVFHKDFQLVWYELEMFKVCRDNMPCEVHSCTLCKKEPTCGYFWGCRKKWKKSLTS